MTTMKLGLIVALLVATVTASSAPAEARTTRQHRSLRCQTVYVLGGTVTTCK